MGRPNNQQDRHHEADRSERPLMGFDHVDLRNAPRASSHHSVSRGAPLGAPSQTTIFTPSLAQIVATDLQVAGDPFYRYSTKGATRMLNIFFTKSGSAFGSGRGYC